MSDPLADPPRFRLFDGPSPLAPLPGFSAALGHGVEIWIKREDLLPLAFGGNKLRNLEFLVGAALADGADTLITSGRRWSNHCRLTAAAGAKAGLAVELVLSGPPADPPGPGLRLMQALGATVHQLPTDDRVAREGEVERVAAVVRARGGRPYVIGVGGSGAFGAYGQYLAGLEAFDQAAASAAGDFDVIVVPTATGGTHAGLVAACAGRSPGTRVAGMVVARSAADLRPAIESMVRDLGSATPPAADLSMDLDETQLGDGYGRPTTAAAEAAELLARSEAILVDPIYTAKALAGLVAAVRAGRWDGRRILFWHAGGLPGIFEPLD
ncbi:MAG TPA: pyridoxal-phosphate dependent enzyme [Methylomirabilota bacterium]|nr:pyridoxal-phosphate dependent enzyme [Methylomirabilota bacterium]